MEKLDFTSKATSYEKAGLVQQLAGDILLNLLCIESSGSVLDLGCGPGGITARIARMTSGRVVGVDISDGMIAKAKETPFGLPNLSFEVKDASQLDYFNEFDYIFCNSAFQWFTAPHLVLKRCWNALKPGGTISIQAPATSRYCPMFVDAASGFARNQKTSATFKHFKSPYLFLESSGEYHKLFSQSGFEVEFCKFAFESNRFTVDEVMGIFKSGAENGYLNQAYYDVALDSKYIDSCRGILRSLLQSKADAYNKVDLEFTRVYIIARRTL